ncbi:MAG: transcriptional regulator [Gammaproteobacteria bacterium RIFCSPHIGHO2_12_FULL_35_23]|nr:MAG: transcriptional regulator [Gammaproteobacteria bacterium RIFCSPHIGHO2_12_FULL_35_23]
MPTEQPSALQFPCEFPIKVIGNNSETFEIEVLTIIKQYVRNLRENAIRTKPSKNSKYLAITITINAQSQQQLDTIYQALNQCPLVQIAL